MNNRRVFLGASAAALAGSTLPAGASERFRWRMITSWPKNSPGVGRTAQRLADRITQMSQGQLEIKLYSAGELVGALQVMDAVGQGTAELGHTASFFWTGKKRAAAFYTAVPFGLTPTEHGAWIYHGGGQQLWDELYRELHVKPFLAGNSGSSMGGWFRRKIGGLADLKGLKYRIPGLGGEVYRRLGVLPVIVPPGEIFTALQTGNIDAAEFLGPWSDLAFGFYRTAPYYYWPGFHEPNGSSECLVNIKAWTTLPDHLKAIVESACAAENGFSLAEVEWQNARALKVLESEHKVSIERFPDEVIQAARVETDSVLQEFAKGTDLEQRILASYSEATRRAARWSSVATAALMSARNS